MRPWFAKKVLAALLVSWSVSCTLSAPRDPKEPGELCGDLAYLFYVATERKNRGVTQEDQLADVSGQHQTETDWKQILDLVYRYHGSPEQVSAAVLDNCVVNREGQARVRALFPLEPS